MIWIDLNPLGQLRRLKNPGVTLRRKKTASDRWFRTAQIVKVRARSQRERQLPYPSWQRAPTTSWIEFAHDDAAARFLNSLSVGRLRHRRQFHKNDIVALHWQVEFVMAATADSYRAVDDGCVLRELFQLAPL